MSNKLISEIRTERLIEMEGKGEEPGGIGRKEENDLRKSESLGSVGKEIKKNRERRVSLPEKNFENFQT